MKKLTLVFTLLGLSIFAIAQNEQSEASETTEAKLTVCLLYTSPSPRD